MRKKYLVNSGIYFAKHRSGDSPMWSDLLHIRDIYLCGRRMAIEPSFEEMLGVVTLP
jgi:hypothetical protein